MPPFNLFKKQASPQPKKDAPALGGERGYTGTQFYSGFISGEEYQTELQWQNGVEVYDRMRRSDGQIRGVLQSIMLPIRGAAWSVSAGENTGASTEQAYEIENNLLHGMELTWDDTIRQILSYLIFGFSIFEKVYEIRNGKLFLKKLAPRIQKTLYRWNVDEAGVFSGIQQYVIRPNSRTEYIDIESNRLVLFVNDQEGSNFEGISILRSAYKHWYIKDKLYEIDSIGHDRFASGVPWAKEPAINNNPADRTRAETVLTNLHSREKSYMLVPSGWEIGIFEKAGSNESLIKSIQHHNEEIAKNVLAQFINLGTTQSGSRSLGESFEELFLLSINTVARYVCEVINRTVIKDLCTANYNIPEDKYPKLTCGKIVLSSAALLNSLKTAKDGGFLTPDIDIENFVRKVYGLATITEEQELDRKNKNEGKDNATNDTNDKDADTDDTDNANDNKGASKTDTELHAHEHGIQLREYGRRRELSEIEIKCSDIEKIEKGFSEGAERNKKVIEKIRDKQIEGVAQQIVRKDPADVSAPFIGEMARALYDEMVKTYQQGKADLRDELNRQLKKGEITLAETISDMEAMKVLKRKAKMEAVAAGNRIVNNAIFQYGRITPADPEEESRLITTEIKKTGEKEILSVSQGLSSFAYGIGRDEAANENAVDIEYAVYSAILDDRACENCLPKDMVQHDLDDPEFETPSSDCLGGEGRCRCVNIYKMKGMDGDFAVKSKADYERDIKAVKDGNLDADKMRTRYELPKYTEAVPGDPGFGVGK